jgi:hypothetical protein
MPAKAWTPTTAGKPIIEKVILKWRHLGENRNPVASVAVGISCMGPWVGNRAVIPVLVVPLNSAP